MANLPAGVPLKALASLLEKLRCQGQIHLRIGQVGMSEVDREVINEPLYVGPLSIPFGQSVDREAVALMPISA
jgi:hypothetical protein